jgi:predicted Zn-dependent protease
MAVGSYNPNAAVGFWERMKAVSGASTTPGFLRTHPNDDERIKDIKALLPKAMTYYKP